MNGVVGKMQRRAFSLKIKAGVKEEYKRRHDEIWPEMRQMLADAGLRNYSIWMMGDDMLFGYYETDDDDYAVRFQAESKIGQKHIWLTCWKQELCRMELFSHAKKRWI